MAIYRFNTIPIKTQIQFDIDLKKTKLNFIWENKNKTKQNLSNFNKNDQPG